MSRKFKSQASSSRAVSGAFAFGNTSPESASTFGAVSPSLLSYVYEPPDLNNVSEPNIAVALKNLQKKDSTTKARALEDLQTYVTSLTAEKDTTEESIVEAWIKLYPRTSIDSSRRVRQLAHAIHGQIALSCGKRIAKHLPKAVGAWLAGLYDNDKVVARTALEAFAKVFPSNEKRKTVWKAYYNLILEYCRDAILREDVRTLSDERTTTPDDADAKYARVIGTTMLVIANAVDTLPAEDFRSRIELYEELLNSKRLWKFATHTDAFVRRALYRLLAAILASQPNFHFDLKMISAHVVQDALHIDQTGTAFEYARTLVDLSRKSPDVWTNYYPASIKKSVIKRLCQFLRKGSQGGHPDYWAKVFELLRLIPLSVLTTAEKSENIDAKPEDLSYSYPILTAIHDGITRRDEHISGKAEAWSTYLCTADLLWPPDSAPDSSHRYVKDFLVPIIEQYVRPNPQAMKWDLGSSNQQAICLRVAEMIMRKNPKIFEKTWNDLSSEVIQDLQISLPEQPKDYKKLQEAIVREVQRWYALYGVILGLKLFEPAMSLFRETILSELKAAMATLKARNGKPYGAAAALDAVLRVVPATELASEVVKSTILEFAQVEAPSLLLSPSSSYLLAFMAHLAEYEDIQDIVRDSIKALLNAPPSVTKSSALRSLVSSPWLGRGDVSKDMVTVVKDSLNLALGGDDDGWSLIGVSLENPAVPDDLADSLLVGMTESLSINEKVTEGLKGLDLAIKTNRNALDRFCASKNGATLLSRILFLTESPDDDVAHHAQELNSAIHSTLSRGVDSNMARNPLVEIIKKGLDKADGTSLSILSLFDQACKLVEQSSQDSLPSLMREILPQPSQWNSAFDPFFKTTPPTSLAIMNIIGGGIFMVEMPDETSDAVDKPIHRDLDGYSSVFRLAWYTTKLFSSPERFGTLIEEEKALTLKNLALFVQLGTDNLSIPYLNGLWQSEGLDYDTVAVDLIAEAQKFLSFHLRRASGTKVDFVKLALEKLIDASLGKTPLSYYSARAYAATIFEIKEICGPTNISTRESQVKIMYKSRDTLFDLALLEGVSESKPVVELYNRVVADLTGRSFRESFPEILRLLVLLNCITQSQDDAAFSIPQQRTVFFVKHMIKIFQDSSLPPSVAAESYRILNTTLQVIKYVYGSHWEEILDIIVLEWSHIASSNDDIIPALHASLRLCLTLNNLVNQEANDDLVEAWIEKKGSLVDGLMKLMQLQSSLPDESYKTREMVNSLLARVISKVVPSYTGEIKDLYRVVACESAALQDAAFDILHRNIPTGQEEVSVEAALSKTYEARLPEELLSMILAAPKPDQLVGFNFQKSIPQSLRSYLLSWRLVFDHWTNASYKVQCDYVTSIKEGSYVQELLIFTFDFLIGSRPKPVDASQYDVESYNADTEDSPERDTQRLLIHVYYLCLKYLPTLSKSWWRDDCSRHLQKPVEAWTEKYISPIVIASELATVTTWLPTQETPPDTFPLIVKVSPRAHELTASYPLDDQTMSIRIQLPPTYPLAPIAVDSVHRVGIDDKRWRSWLITTAGVINFSSSSGALIDGLMAWRKNVTGALKGQSECAICYSVVGADRQLPSKQCSTCKNFFHGGCLYRWFKSSSSSSCPLCRNAFNYG